MNNKEAGELLQAHLEKYRQRSYAELVDILDHPKNTEVRGASGTTYQVEVQVFWDGRPGEDVRVLGSIDSGGLRAFLPLTNDFIMTPTGRFVGE